MKRYLSLFFGTAFSFCGFSQTVNDYTLDLNNANALVNDGGVFFNNESTSQPGFEILSGSQLHTMYSMGFWYGGVDANGQLKLSAQMYENFADQFKGPLTTNGTAEPDNSWTNALFPITKDEILFHQANYQNAGYVPAANIANWPAHGNVNQDFYLAPFVDVDGDGTYDPLNGDYPCMRGDQAVYVIMNDRGAIHASGGDQIGIEMHYMFYEYVGQAELENTIFVSGKVINRGTQTLNDFKVSVFMDGEIGYGGDDYFSSDSTRNLMSFYNGDAFDEPGGLSMGYGSAPPASGVVSLSKDFESIGAILDFAPSFAVQYYNLMRGFDINGNPWTNTAGSAPTKFLFPSDPSSAEPNSEAALATPPGDRRGIANWDFGVLEPSAEHHFDIAVIYNRGTVDNVDNASGLRNVADIVQAFFDTTFVDDCISNNTLSLEDVSEADFSVYPNPSHGEFTISLMNDFSSAQAILQDISGRVVLDQLELTSKETSLHMNQPSGVYLLSLIIDGNKMTKRIILE